MHETDELTLADLIADASRIALPAPRSPRRVIDLTVPAQRSVTIPDETVILVDGYADYGV